jgi:DNA-binding CsgD family transcriptional regulator
MPTRSIEVLPEVLHTRSVAVYVMPPWTWDRDVVEPQEVQISLWQGPDGICYHTQEEAKREFVRAEKQAEYAKWKKRRDAEIIQLTVEGMSGSEIAKRAGLSPSGVQKLIQAECWRQGRKIWPAAYSDAALARRRKPRRDNFYATYTRHHALSIADTAAVLGRHPSTVRDLITSGVLIFSDSPGWQGRKMVLTTSIDCFMFESNREHGTSQFREHPADIAEQCPAP